MKIQNILEQGQTFLFDGAMGTLYAAHKEGPCELAALNDPETILDIHRQYLNAGSQAIKTDTFSLTKMLTEQDSERAVSAARAACHLAHEAAKPFNAEIFGDIGPAPEADSFEQLACRQGEIFLEEGISCFLIETMPNNRGIEAFAQTLKRRCPEAFLIVSFAVSPEGYTRDGLTARTLLEETAVISAVDAIGLNCVSGPSHMLKLIQSLPDFGKPLSVMPNAGYPTVLGRRTVFQGKPDYFADKCAEIAAEGASILGGCCGTTPEHIAAVADRLTRPVQKYISLHESPHPEHASDKENSLKEKLDRGEKVIAVELDPPMDDHIEEYLQHIQSLKETDVDVVTIADCPVGRPRADSSLLACKIKRERGIEPLPHMTCRDRNLNATKALLLGLSMEGVHNVLLVTGDPIPSADQDQVKSVFNFNSRKLIRYVASLDQETLSVPFYIFGALNLNATNFQIQLKLALEKEENGVQGFLTQPILSKEAMDNLKLARQTLKSKILAGIYPVVSYRNACFMNNEISGIRVCEEIVDLYRDKNREESEELAVKISEEVASDSAPYCDGYYLMTPFNRVQLVCQIIKDIRQNVIEDGGNN